MGLQAGDLRHLVYDIFEVDSYQSKMGDDKDIVVCSFVVQDKEPAKDLVNFIEKGYSFVLDADVSAGEMSDGMYRVFVEMERNKDVPNNIMEMLYGVKNLTEIDAFKFRYYKNFRSTDANEQTLEETIPLDSESYYNVVNEGNLSNYKNFFSQSYMDDVTLLGESLKLMKVYAEPVTLKIVDFGQDLKPEGTIQLTPQAISECLYLTKYAGDYNITKYGDKFVFENAGNTLIVEHIK